MKVFGKTTFLKTLFGNPALVRTTAASFSRQNRSQQGGEESVNYKQFTN